MRRLLVAALAAVWLAGPAAAQDYRQDPAALVGMWYQKFLNRQVDPSGMQTWTTSLAEGNAPEMVLATILENDEYYNRAGGTPDTYIRSLFLDIAGREPTSREYDAWIRRLTLEGRRNVAYTLLRRYPEGWQEPAARAERDDDRYSYRRPFLRYRR